MPGEFEALVVDADAVGGELGAGGFALGGDLEALFIEGAAVLEGEDAEEVLEQGRAGGGRRGEGEGALLNDEEAGFGEFGLAAGEKVVELVDGGDGILGDVEEVGEVEFVFVPVERGGVNADVEFGPDFLLGFGEGASAEEVVDVFELVGVEGGELGKGAERASP